MKISGFSLSHYRMRFFVSIIINVFLQSSAAGSQISIFNSQSAHLNTRPFNLDAHRKLMLYSPAPYSPLDDDASKKPESDVLMCELCSHSTGVLGESNLDRRELAFRSSLVCRDYCGVQSPAFSICDAQSLICVNCILQRMAEISSTISFFDLECRYCRSEYSYESLVKYLDYGLNFAFRSSMHGKVDDRMANDYDILVMKVLYDLLEDGYGFLLLCYLRYDRERLSLFKKYIDRHTPFLIKALENCQQCNSPDKGIHRQGSSPERDISERFEFRRTSVRMRIDIYRRLDRFKDLIEDTIDMSQENYQNDLIEDTIDMSQENYQNDGSHKNLADHDDAIKYAYHKEIYSLLICNSEVDLEVLRGRSNLADRENTPGSIAEQLYKDQTTILYYNHLIKRKGPFAKNLAVFLEEFKLDNTLAKYTHLNEYVGWYYASESKPGIRDAVDTIYFFVANGLHNSNQAIRHSIEFLAAQLKDGNEENRGNCLYGVLAEIIEKLPNGSIDINTSACINAYLGFSAMHLGHADYAEVYKLMNSIKSNSLLRERISHYLYIEPYYKHHMRNGQSISKKIKMLSRLHADSLGFAIPYIVDEIDEHRDTYVLSDIDEKGIMSLLVRGVEDENEAKAIVTIFQSFKFQSVVALKNAFHDMMMSSKKKMHLDKSPDGTFTCIFTEVLKRIRKLSAQHMDLDKLKLAEIHLLMLEVFKHHASSGDSIPRYMDLHRSLVCLFYLKIMKTTFEDPLIKSICSKNFNAIWNALTTIFSIPNSATLGLMCEFFTSFTLEEIAGDGLSKNGEVSIKRLAEIVRISKGLPFRLDKIFEIVYLSNARIEKAIKLLNFEERYLLRNGVSAHVSNKEFALIHIRDVLRSHDNCHPRNGMNSDIILLQVADILKMENIGLSDISEDLCEAIVDAAGNILNLTCTKINTDMHEE